MPEKISFRIARMSAFFLLPLALLSHTGFPAHPKKTDPLPVYSLDIRSLGFKPASEKDFKRLDRELFRSGDIARLESDDFHVKLAFTSKETVAAYWTRGPGGELRSDEPLIMEAIFLDTSGGALKHRERWPVRKRQSSSEYADTEGRILPVNGGRFVVHAGRKLMLYSPDFTLLSDTKLESDSKGKDRWSIHVPPGGSRLFLRHEFKGGVRYSWLYVDTLAPIQPEVAPPPRQGLASETIVHPTATGYFLQRGSTLEPYPPTDGAKIFCDPTECRYMGFNALMLTGGQVLLASEHSIIVYARDGSPIWSRETSAKQPWSEVARSLDGRTYVVLMSAKRGEFDGIRLSEDPTLFIYDLASQQRKLEIQTPFDWDLTFDIAPDGSKLAVLQGTTVQVFKSDSH